MKTSGAISPGSPQTRGAACSGSRVSIDDSVVGGTRVSFPADLPSLRLNAQLPDGGFNAETQRRGEVSNTPSPRLCGSVLKRDRSQVDTPSKGWSDCAACCTSVRGGGTSRRLRRAQPEQMRDRERSDAESGKGSVACAHRKPSSRSGC